MSHSGRPPGHTIVACVACVVCVRSVSLLAFFMDALIRQEADDLLYPGAAEKRCYAGKVPRRRAIGRHMQVEPVRMAATRVLIISVSIL